MLICSVLRLHCIDYIEQNVPQKQRRRVWRLDIMLEDLRAKTYNGLDLFAGERAVTRGFRPRLIVSTCVAPWP